MQKISFLIILFVSLKSFALTNEMHLTNQAQEHRAKELFKQVRCVVCDGESINDSKADIAKSLRLQIRQKIQDGQSDEYILHSLTGSYGAEILMKPPIKPATYLLWYSPFILLLIIIPAIMWQIAKHNKPQ